MKYWDDTDMNHETEDDFLVDLYQSVKYQNMKKKNQYRNILVVFVGSEMIHIVMVFGVVIILLSNQTFYTK